MDFIPLDPEQQPGYLIVRAAELISRPWSAGLRAHGINPRQFSVLALIAGSTGLSQAELSRRAFITPQSMGELLTRLEMSGLVVRAHDQPGQPARVELTDDGKATLNAAYPIVRELQDASVAALSADEQSTLKSLLAKVIAQHER